jgi:cell division protein ZapA (FtsZ GTPase activity inhibitor)
VKWAYEGLLWVGAAQVDPGWVGHLFCPLYNLSNKEVVLRFGDPIALMDFVTTTPFRPADSVPYIRPPKRVLLEEYQATELKSALYALATTTLKDFEENLKQINLTVESRVSEIRSRVDYFVLITFTVIAVLFAAVTIFVARSEQLSWWNPIPLFLLSGTALFFSASAWIRAYQEQKFFGRVIQSVAIAILLVAAVLTVVELKETRPLYQQIDELKGKVEGLQQQIKALSPVPASSSPAFTPPAAPNAANQNTHKKSP